MTAYYNEIDPYAAQWLRNLIAAGHIAPGDVDERSIVDVRGDDLRSYDQCHFFAGIGGWSRALRLAGWDDNRPVWTGSCPCQPFSAAGKGEAANDERHLWPSWFPLIAQRRPAIVFGEQVEAAIGWGWLDAVFADLEGQGYACGAAVLPACGLGAPHIRARTWFVADVQIERWDARRASEAGRRQTVEPSGYRDDSELADRIGTGLEVEREQPARYQRAAVERGCAIGDVAHHPNTRGLGVDGITPEGRRGQPHAQQRLAIGELGNAEGGDGRLSERSEWQAHSEPAGPSEACELGNPSGGKQWRLRESGTIERRSSAPGGPSSWGDCEWLPCTDGKARPVEPGTFPLAHGIPGRVGRLRAYGNAIVPQVAAEFIAAAVSRTL